MSTTTANNEAKRVDQDIVERVTMRGRRLAVSWLDGRERLYPFIWLRDNCPCEACRDQKSGQRLSNILDLPAEVAPRRLDVSVTDNLVIEWEPDGHKSRYRTSWLAKHDLGASAWRRSEAKPWGAELGAELPRADWNDILGSPAGEREALIRFRDYGFVIIGAVPTSPGMVAEVGSRFGHVRVTNYGRIFDVVSKPSANNLAYTDRALTVHTDNPYRDPAPGVQLLHCLVADAPGGENILVDGFRAAEELRRRDAAGFDLLTRLYVPFRFADREADLRAHAPIITTDREGRVTEIHFNNRSIDALDLPIEAVESWYTAYRNFAAILHEAGGEVRVRLDPGELLMMANNRVLHGRTGFDASVGRRHLQGCYVDRDGVDSRLRVLGRRGSRL